MAYSAWRRLRTDLTTVCSFLVRGLRGADTDLCAVVTRTGLREEHKVVPRKV